MPWIQAWCRLYCRLWAKDWALAPAQLGWIVSIAFVGMALGAVFSGWLADRFGRKPFLPAQWWCTALPQVCARLRLI